jgi:mono/diheme cytochrome c family protein
MNKKRFSTQFLKITAIAILFLVGQKSTQAQTKPWKVPESAAKVKNPLANNAASRRKGKTLFISNCAPCHGKNGKGDGPGSVSLDPKPADLSSPWKSEDTDGALYYMISTGHIPMPKFKATLNDRQRWELVNYIRTLPQKHK